MGNRRFHRNSLIAQGLRDAFQVLLARFHLRRGGLLAVNLAGDAFLHVQQVKRGAVELGHGGGVADGQPVEVGMVERHQDPVVDGRVARCAAPAVPAGLIGVRPACGAAGSAART